MDPLIFYTVGLTRQQELLREAGNARRIRWLRAAPGGHPGLSIMTTSYDTYR